MVESDKHVPEDEALPVVVASPAHVVDADEPVVVVSARKRPTALLELSGKRYRVMKPKRMVALQVADKMSLIDEMMLSTDPADRAEAIRWIRRWVTIVFDRTGHVEPSATEPDTSPSKKSAHVCECDACDVLRVLEGDGDEDIDDITDAMEKLNQHWEITPPRAVRRAAAKANGRTGRR